MSKCSKCGLSAYPMPRCYKPGCPGGGLIPRQIAPPEPVWRPRPKIDWVNVFTWAGLGGLAATCWVLLALFWRYG